MAIERRMTLEELMHQITQMQDRGTVKTVFGDPLEVDGQTIIPVAAIRYAFGVGMGRGTSEKQVGSGEGGGGGGGVTVRPVAVLEINKKGAHVRPIPDVTRLALAGLALVAWNVFWIAYTVRKTAGRR